MRSAWILLAKIVGMVCITTVVLNGKEWDSKSFVFRSCGHKIKAYASPVFIEKSPHSESMVAPRDQSMRITPPSANRSDMNG